MGLSHLPPEADFHLVVEEPDSSATRVPEIPTLKSLSTQAACAEHALAAVAFPVHVPASIESLAERTDPVSAAEHYLP